MENEQEWEGGIENGRERVTYSDLNTNMLPEKITFLLKLTLGHVICLFRTLSRSL